MSLSDPCAGERCAVCWRCVAIFSFGVADRGRPCRQRAADVRRYGVSSRCTPSVIGKSVCHVKTTVRRTPPSRGTLATWTGGQRGGIPAPRPDRAPPPKKGTRYTLNRFNRFESTPKKTLRDYRSKATIVPPLPLNRTTSDRTTYARNVSKRAANAARHLHGRGPRALGAALVVYAAEPCCAVEWCMACATAFLSARLSESWRRSAGR